MQALLLSHVSFIHGPGPPISRGLISISLLVQCSLSYGCRNRSTEEEDERVWNPHYAARKAHNEAMRSEAGQRDAIRAMFLKVSNKATVPEHCNG